MEKYKNLLLLSNKTNYQLFIGSANFAPRHKIGHKILEVIRTHYFITRMQVSTDTIHFVVGIV